MSAVSLLVRPTYEAKNSITTYGMTNQRIVLFDSKSNLQDGSLKIYDLPTG